MGRDKSDKLQQALDNWIELDLCAAAREGRLQQAFCVDDALG